ncbi:SH3 domain protein [Dictyocaulus viviparus]|uniref:SH3 domain protein n=1 Tax=Dictyocaulus viviparus TaxID=29172 RepID=A0A0D8XSS2_DICVI|nr:SH3 domain protein [Dictyocaulus viviparus]
MMDLVQEVRYCVDFTEEVTGRDVSSGALPLKAKMGGATESVVKALYDYSAADKDEVSFLEGDIIVNCEKVDDGWMTGTVQRTLQWGMLPANYVQPHKLPTGMARIKAPMSSFDDEERRAKYALAPKSNTHGKVVKLSPKRLRTNREVRTVLPEEQYLAKLEKIIVRDYFPDLPKLQAQSEYMDAVKRNDVAKMRELQLRYHTGRHTLRRTSPIASDTTPGHRAATSPVNFDPDTPGPSKPIDDLQGTPLPYSNCEGDNDAVKAKIGKKKSDTDELSVDAYMTKPKEVDNWTYTARNSVLFHLEGAPLTAEERMEQARRNQRVINKAGTRFPEDMKNKPSEASMARASMVQLANNIGKVDAQGREVGLNAKALELVATPSPVPGVDDSPLMTWGEIDGTPFRLDGADIQPPVENAPTFKMPEVPFREQVALGISDTIAKRYRDKRRTAMQAAEKAHRTPRFGSAHSSVLSLATLSPAARRLASTKLGIRLPSAEHLRGVTPLRNSSLRLSPRVCSNSKTPLGIKKTPVMVSGKEKASSITDNLMPVSSEDCGTSTNSRPSAGDFF